MSLQRCLYSYLAYLHLARVIPILTISPKYSENSQVANARFQAAAAIRDAAIREWGFLAADEIRSLIR